MTRVWLGIATSTVLLWGCASSPPLHFYTLSDVAPNGAGASQGGTSSDIRVTRVKIPGEIDRTELVQRLDANRLQIAEQDRWAAPLDDMIRRTLSADLQARLASSASQNPASPQSEPATLALEVQEFTADTRCAVTLRASWELRSPGVTVPQTGRELIHSAASASTACTIAAVPLAMSQALAELSERILATRR